LKKIFLFLLALSLCTRAFSQYDNSGRRIVEKNTTPLQRKLDSSFVYKDKRYQYYNNWFTAGAGVQQNLTYNRELGFVAGLDVQLHIKQHYIQTGLLIMGPHYGSYNNYQVHLGYGKRFEDQDIHFSFFAGLSYNSGYTTVMVDTVETYRTFQQPGLYFQSEIIKKIKYDIGVGFSLFGDFNQEQSIMGLRGILYFSGAYNGRKNKVYESE
jgi:hypothetical protein